MNPTDARLFPDFAAVPTRAERAGTARFWQDRQTSLMLDTPAEPEHQCDACTGDHPTDACPHGTALTLGDAALAADVNTRTGRAAIRAWIRAPHTQTGDN